MRHSEKNRRKGKYLCRFLASAAAALGVLAALLLRWEPTEQQPTMELSAPERRVEQRRQETSTLVLPAQTVYIGDSTLPKGSRKQLSEGRDGELLCVADVRYVNGIEESRTWLRRELMAPAEDRIVALGEREAEAETVIENGRIELPDGERMYYTKSASFSVCAYTHTDLFRSKTTALGTAVHIGTAAADPSRLPFGTRLFLVSGDGSRVYGVVRVEDTLTGTEEAELALYFPTVGECMDFGIQQCTAYFLG